MVETLVGIIIGVALSQVIQHWDAVGPALSAVWVEIKAIFRK